MGSNIFAHRQSVNEFILEENFRILNLEYWFFKGNTNAHRVLDQSLLDEDDHRSMLLLFGLFRFHENHMTRLNSETFQNFYFQA